MSKSITLIICRYCFGLAIETHKAQVHEMRQHHEKEVLCLLLWLFVITKQTKNKFYRIK